MVTLERIEAGSVQGRRHTPDPATSPLDEAAIEQRICSTSASLFWSMRLLPGPRRKAMQALYVFCREVGDIADGEGSRTLKLQLLADWREQIALLYAGRPQHNVARALRDAMERLDLRCDDFLTIIDGVKMDLSADMRAPSLEQLDFYCEHMGVAVSRIALHILGATASDANRVAAPLGRGMQLTGILSGLAHDAARHRLYLPRELLHAHGIFATMPSYVLAQPALLQVCNALAERAAAHFAEAEREIGARPVWAALAAATMLSSYRKLLKALVIRGWTRLDEPAHIPAWCQTAVLIGHGLTGR